MPNYDLNRLGPDEFEHLFQSLLKSVIGSGTITFGEGPDGGREAIYQGKAHYPSPAEQWDGVWIFQAKFHDVNLLGPDKARRAVLNDLKSELEKICLKHKRKCDNYILGTNVPLSSVSDVGTHDKIAQEIMPEFLEKISHVHVWGYDELARFLDAYPAIRQSYLHLIAPGDLIAELMDSQKTKKSNLAEVVQLYVSTSFQRDQYALLDQAGEIGEKPMPLRRVFIDLNLKLRNEKDLMAFAKDRPDLANRLRHLLRQEATPATEVLVRHGIPRTVLIGGPGQGKSTLGQFIAQIHRAFLLRQDEDVEEGKHLLPSMIRVPFRVSLKDYAQWIADSQGPRNLETYLAALVEERAGRHVSSDHVQQILKQNPSILILDGLDEVTDPKLRSQMLALITEFIDRIENVLKSDLQIVATSRPTGYSDQFDPSHFLHLNLDRMYQEKVTEYIERWIRAKALEPPKANFLRSSIADCLKDPHFSNLMNTPLQVTIFILIILNGGTPPRQREELFNEYLEVIYKRERSKSKTIIVTEKRLLFGLHQYIGYVLHRNAAEADTRSRMREEEFGHEVLLYLRNNDPYSDIASLKQKADQMIKEAQERLVLLVQLEQGFFGFELRSIQEFFAAGHLADTAFDNKQRFARFQAIALPAHWRNVALFFAGRVGRSYPGEAAHILEACREIDRHQPDNLIKRGAWLALEIAVDRSFGPNRILQRSAIEYAITLLDKDIDGEKRAEFVSKVKELPQEDVNDHVIPLLTEKLKTVNLPDGFPTAEIFCDLSEDRTIIEKVMTFAHEKHHVDPQTLLQKALEFRLSPKYLTSEFLQAFKLLSEEQLSVLLLFPFINEPKYVTTILKELDTTGAVAKSVFRSALPFGRSYRPFEKIPLPEAIPKNIVDQISLAWQLTLATGYMSRDAVRFLDHDATTRFQAVGYFDEIVDQSSAWTIPRDTPILEKIVTDDSVALDLRIAALGLLSRISFYSASPSSLQLLEKISDRFFKSLTLHQVEIAEEALYQLRAPSIESMRSISELKQFENPRRLLFFLASGRHTGRKPETMRNSEAFVTDALASPVWSKIASSESDLKGDRKDLPNSLLRLGTRMGVIEPSPLMNLESVERIIDSLTKSMTEQVPTKWRAWEVLTRLVMMRWRKSEDIGGVEKAIQLLCERLAREIESASGCWQIGGLIPRILDIGGHQSLVQTVFMTLDKMPTGRRSERGNRVTYAWRLDETTLREIVRIALQSDASVLRGFMKWFAATVTNLASEPEERFTKISFDLKPVISSFDKFHGPGREGAILLLAHSHQMSIEQTTELLEGSGSELEWTDEAWGELVANTAPKASRDKIVPFLEGLWSQRKRYPESVRYAAISRYEEIEKSATVEIKDLESMLGLPFQNELERRAAKC